MSEEKNKNYDLEERTFLFAQAVRKFIKQLPKTISNIEDCKQLTRASGSVGANYIEANESLGKKDFLMQNEKRNSFNEFEFLLLILFQISGLDIRIYKFAKMCQNLRNKILNLKLC